MEKWARAIDPDMLTWLRVGGLRAGGATVAAGSRLRQPDRFSSSGWAGRCAVNEVGRAVRGDGVAVGQQFTGVLEDHDAVAKQAPALFRVADKGPSRFAV
jgi:hypothetical protein